MELSHVLFWVTDCSSEGQNGRMIFLYPILHELLEFLRLFDRFVSFRLAGGIGKIVIDLIAFSPTSVKVGDER